MAKKPMISIELGEGFVSKTRSIDKRIKGALLAALGIGKDAGPVRLAVGESFGTRMTPSFESLMKRTRDELREETPRSKGALKTGPHLADGWRVRTRVNSAGKRFEIDNKDPRAEKLLAIFEYGTKVDYEIKPKNKKALAFYWEKQNKHAVFRRVTHPGINQYVGFIAKARRRLRRRTTAALVSLEKRWIRNVGV